MDAVDEVFGTGAAPGTARGPATALVSEVLPTDLPPGAIIVARVVHPYMAPLFFAAGGVVAEEGGVLQHAAILAREFGVPAVVGVANAVARFGRDTMLYIDGTVGLVRSVPAEDGQ